MYRLMKKDFFKFKRRNPLQRGEVKTLKEHQMSVCLMSVSYNRMNQTQQILDYLHEHYVFRYNTANHKMAFHHVGESEFEYLSDEILNSIKVEVNLANISCSRENLRTIIFSNNWEFYDPYKKWLESLPVWDGEDYITKLAKTVKTTDDEYWYWAFKKWIVAFVGSLAEDEVVNQVAPIFTGKQGIGKSTWFAKIMPPELKEYTAFGTINPKDKETLVQLSELCLYCMDECENLKPKNVEAIKNILTMPRMYLRRAYTTLSSTYVRRCSFCGTANGTNILHDVTGNRRFCCLDVQEIDYNFDIDLTQVYAQAYQLFRSGKFRYWFDQEDQKTVEEHNLKFRYISVEEEILTAYYEPCEIDDEGAIVLQCHELLTLLQQKSHYNRMAVETLGKLLAKLGYKVKKSGVKKWIVKEKAISDEA